MIDDPISPTPLTPDQKTRWNAFVEFVALQKMANNPALDQRNKNLGLMLINKFNMAYPKQQIQPDIVRNVQQEIQDYRNNVIKQWKAGKVVVEGVKDEKEIMPNLSPVDGWPGSKTLSHRFPVAKTDTKDYGTDTDQYDKDRGLASN